MVPLDSTAPATSRGTEVDRYVGNRIRERRVMLGLSQQQMVIFEKAMKMFNPFYSDEQESPPAANGGERSKARGNQIQELRSQLNEMQRQLNALTKGQGET